MGTDQAARIRQAFAAGEFATAQALWNEYAAAISAAIAAGTAPSETMAEVGQLVEAARCMVRSARARAAEQLGHARAAQAYSR